MLISVSVGMSLGPPPDFGTDESEESTHLAASGRGPRRGKILIMDDDSMMRDMMSRHLTICGYEVAATVHGEDAVRAYREAREAGRPFAAVILDLEIPNGWGGEQTLVELLKLDPGVKAMVCSGSLAGSNAHYEQKGFRGILGKPYSLADLRSQLETVLLSQGSA
jgi:CheY-like chemotaxis protein